jgi:acyl-CoA thioester hydrolase
MRRYEFVRVGDETVLATAETDWVYVDRTTGRPKRIPAAIGELFGLGVDPSD